MFKMTDFAVVFPVQSYNCKLPVSVHRMASVYCAVAGAALLGYLCLFDKRFGVAVLGFVPRVEPGVYCKRSPRAEAVISRVSALRHPYYKGYWLIQSRRSYLGARVYVRRIKCRC